MNSHLKASLIFVVLMTGAMYPLRGSAADGETRHRVAFNGTLTSSDSYSLEASYHFMPCKYVGIGGAIGHWANYYVDGWASGSNWSISSDYEKPENYYIRPSVILKSPAINYRASSWSLFAEPGVMLSIPYQRVCIESTSNWPDTEYDYISTGKGQWLACELRLGISLQVGPCGVSAGYMMSNLDIYSQYRHLSYKGIYFKDFYPVKSFMQGAYLSLSYNL